MHEKHLKGRVGILFQISCISPLNHIRYADSLAMQGKGVLSSDWNNVAK